MIFKAEWEKTDTVHKLPIGLVEKMVHHAYPDKTLQSYNLIAGGCANLNFKIQLKNEPNSFILRVYLRDKEAAHKEQSLYKLLKDTVPVPQIYFVGSVDNYQFAIVQFMPGITLRDLLLSNRPHNLEKIMYQVGVSLSKIVSHKFSKCGFLNEKLEIIEELSNDSLIEFSLSCLEHQKVKKYLGSEMILKIKSLLASAPKLDNSNISLVHADFDPANILIDNIDGNWQVSAILDWEFAYAGSWLNDVANMLRYAHKMPNAFKTSFLKGLTDNHFILPKNWKNITNQYTLASLLDSTIRHPLEICPNICTDIKELIKHILLELDSIRFIEVVPYNPDWPLEFEKEEAKIKAALGDNCLRIHHIGSTSVEGLAAKPLIDMIPVVRDILTVDKIAMERLGYEARGEFGIPFRRFFCKEKEIRTHNIHIFEQGNTEIERHLKFRDWMRNHSDDRNAYAKLKIDLAEKFPNDIYSYCVGKDEFIAQIDRKAGWNDYRFVIAETPKEWQEYHRIRREQIFDPLNIIYDKNHPSLTAPNHFHFVLYKGEEIVTVAHVEFLERREAALRSLATDEPYKMQGYAKYMMQLLEKWITQQGKQIIKLHANPDAEQFYRKLEYDNMEFDDVSISKDTIDLGKRL